MSYNAYFYLPDSNNVKTTKDVIEFFNEKLSALDDETFSNLKLIPGAWGHYDENTGMHRPSITSATGKGTEFMVLTEIDDAVFGHAGDDRSKWIRIRLGKAQSPFSDALSKIAVDMDGWAAPDSKAFVRLNTGDSFYLLLGGEQNKKETSRSEMIAVLNRLSEDGKKIKSTASDQEIQTAIAKRLRLDSSISKDGVVTIPIKKTYALDFSPGAP